MVEGRPQPQPAGRGYGVPASGGGVGRPHLNRWSHLMAPSAGNGKFQDEAARLQNAPGGSPDYYPVGTQNPRRPFRSQFAPDGEAPNDQRWIKDRHPTIYSGTERSGRLSGLCDPMLSGPARPSTRMLNRTYNKPIGTDATRNFDPNRSGYRPVGWQDGSPTRLWGGTPGYMQPYGQRGTGEEVGRDTSGSATMPGTVPHGLHTHTVQSRRMTLAVYAGTAQMRRPRQDRLSNSVRSGQSYSATTQQQGGR